MWWRHYSYTGECSYPREIPAEISGRVKAHVACNVLPSGSRTPTTERQGTGCGGEEEREGKEAGEKGKKRQRKTSGRMLTTGKTKWRLCVRICCKINTFPNKTLRRKKAIQDILTGTVCWQCSCLQGGPAERAAFTRNNAEWVGSGTGKISVCKEKGQIIQAKQ